MENTKPKKPKPKAYQYWGIFDDGQAATPRGPKGYVEKSAAMLSGPGAGSRRVCIKKVPKGGFGEIDTGVCYINGVREKRRR